PRLISWPSARTAIVSVTTRVPSLRTSMWLSKPRISSAARVSAAPQASTSSSAASRPAARRTARCPNRWPAVIPVTAARCSEGHLRHCPLGLAVELEVFGLNESERAGDEVGRERFHGDVEDADRAVVVAPGELDLVLQFLH